MGPTRFALPWFHSLLLTIELITQDQQITHKQPQR